MRQSLGAVGAKAADPRRIVGAWANINGAASATLRNSFNVSSLTDNGVGDWTLTFTVGAKSANYSVQGMSQSLGGTVTVSTATAPTAAAVRISPETAIGTQTDLDPTTVLCIGAF